MGVCKVRKFHENLTVFFMGLGRCRIWQKLDPWHSLCETLTWVTSTASFSVELIISINPAEVDVWLFPTDALAPQVKQPPWCRYPARCLGASCTLWRHSLWILNWASLTQALLSFLFVEIVLTNRACKIRLESSLILKFSKPFNRL